MSLTEDDALVSLQNRLRQALCDGTEKQCQGLLDWSMCLPLGQTDSGIPFHESSLAPSSRNAIAYRLFVWPASVVLEQPITTSRTLLVSLLATLEQSSNHKSSAAPPKSTKQLAQTVIDKIAPRAVSYEDQLVRACEFLSGLYQSECAYQQAADTLARFDLDSGLRQVESNVKVDKYLRISHLYLEDGAHVDLADAFVKKASSLLSSLDKDKDKDLMLQYLSCSGRLLDRKNKFTEAATRFLDLSKKMGYGETVLGTDKKEALASALACTLLADAGPQRSRLLAKLYKDDDVASMEAYGILEKVFLDRLLLAEDVEAFSRTLGGHHHSGTPHKWGLSVVELAIVQHNLLGCSKLYSSVTITSLAELLSVDEATAMNVVAKMILEDRVRGSIDQISGIVSFEADEVDGGEERENGACQVREALCLADSALSALSKGQGAANPSAGVEPSEKIRLFRL
jgi:COP9 signalosome complex subunit 4